jgi:hypothetical protein
MASKVPPDIRERVLTLWLMAYSRDNIAHIVGIGAGTVSDIVKAYIQSDPEFVLLREFVIAVKKEAGGIKQLATAARLQRFLESHNLDGERIESLISVISSQCFKKGISVQEFVENVNNVSDLADRTDVDLERLSDYILERTRELYLVTNNLSMVKAERDEASRECYEKKNQLERLRKNLSKAQTKEAVSHWRDIETLEKNSLIGMLDHFINEWSFEKFARHTTANELAKVYKIMYGNVDRSIDRRTIRTRPRILDPKLE